MGIWMSTAAEENHAAAALNYHQQQHQHQHQHQQGGGASEGGGGGATTTANTTTTTTATASSNSGNSGSMLTRRPVRGDRSGSAAARKGESTRAADWMWENSHWTKLRANKERDRDVPKCRCVRGLCVGVWLLV
jgi:hypothetical protein